MKIGLAVTGASLASCYGNNPIIPDTGQNTKAPANDIFIPIIKNHVSSTTVPTATNTITPIPSSTPVPGFTINPPSLPVKLIFIHHSTGENWLNDNNGRLGIDLRDNNYFVSDTNYGWGPNYSSAGSSIGDNTDIGNWYDWFIGPSRDIYLNTLYEENDQHCSYSRLLSNPGGENNIVMFKSCFPNSTVYGNPNDPPTTGSNPLRSQPAETQYQTVGNIKGIYIDLLAYFSTRLDKLFVAITAPPLVVNVTNSSQATNARAVNNWIINNWLENYPHKNVAVFDFYNVLTSNGGDSNTNDANSVNGNHHRFRNNAIEHITNQGSNYCQYGVSISDSHPSAAGGQKASLEFLPLLNIFYNRWKQ